MTNMISFLVSDPVGARGEEKPMQRYGALEVPKDTEIHSQSPSVLSQINAMLLRNEHDIDPKKAEEWQPYTSIKLIRYMDERRVYELGKNGTTRRFVLLQFKIPQ